MVKERLRRIKMERLRRIKMERYMISRDECWMRKDG